MTASRARDNLIRLPSSSVSMKPVNASTTVGGRKTDKSGTDISCIPLGVHHIGPPLPCRTSLALPGPDVLDETEVDEHADAVARCASCVHEHGCDRLGPLTTDGAPSGIMAAWTKSARLRPPEAGEPYVR
jgi:hypothetical protein